jgi:hypothetical protein
MQRQELSRLHLHSPATPSKADLNSPRVLANSLISLLASLGYKCPQADLKPDSIEWVFDVADGLGLDFLKWLLTDACLQPETSVLADTETEL